MTPEEPTVLSMIRDNLDKLTEVNTRDHEHIMQALRDATQVAASVAMENRELTISQAKENRERIQRLEVWRGWMLGFMAAGGTIFGILLKWLAGSK